MFRRILVGTLLVGLTANAFAAKNRPDGYTTICKTDQTCTVSQSTNVAFGAADLFVYKVLSGSFVCNTATFGSDPNPAKSVKECSIPSNGGSSSGSSSTSSTSSTSSSSSSSGSGSCSATSQCDWYGGLWPICQNQNDGWGWENSASCIGSNTCSSQSGNGGIIDACSSSSSSSSGGSSSSSSSSSGGSSGKGASCSSTGSQGISSTIRVTSGTYDGNCKTFNPSGALGDGSQSEGQDPAFRVENGATLKNVIIGNNGVDGIHFYNGGTIDNIRWTNVGEDAFTVKSEGNVTARNLEGYDGEDKFIQVNAVTNLSVSNCIVDNMGKFLRQNGGKTFTMSVTVDNCDISNMKEGIFRSDSPNASARITNSRIRNAGDVCIGSWKSCTSSNLSSF